MGYCCRSCYSAVQCYRENNPQIMPEIYYISGSIMIVSYLAGNQLRTSPDSIEDAKNNPLNKFWQTTVYL